MELRPYQRQAQIAIIAIIDALCNGAVPSVARNLRAMMVADFGRPRELEAVVNAMWEHPERPAPVSARYLRYGDLDRWHRNGRTDDSPTSPTRFTGLHARAIQHGTSIEVVARSTPQRMQYRYLDSELLCPAIHLTCRCRTDAIC